MCQHDENMQSEKDKNTIAEIAKGLDGEPMSVPNHPNNDKYCSDGSGAASTIQAFVKTAAGATRVLQIPIDTDDVMKHINKLNVNKEDFYYTTNGKPISKDTKIHEGDTIREHGRLRGGAANIEGMTRQFMVMQQEMNNMKEELAAEKIRSGKTENGWTDEGDFP